jgi:preprotein translocase SecF subunit
LTVYISLALAVFKLWPVTLTLSGIAAFILSIGMAVDANILIFERMKEELRRGRGLNQAIDIGFSRAWSSIRDSNVSTLITCLILYWFGDQFGAALVKGFALTLAIGVLISMFSAITVTRTFLKMVVGTPLAKNRRLFNAYELKREDVREGAGLWRFSRLRWYSLGLSGGLLVAALVILAVPPTLRAGIEFTSGSVFTVQFTEQTVDQTELRTFMSDLGYSEARIQGAGENSYVIRTRELEGAPALDSPVGPVPEGEIETIEAALEERFGAFDRLDFQTISSTVSSEIAQNTAIAIGAAALAIFGYIWIQFRTLPKPRRYGAAAVIALAHDALLVLGLFSLMSKVFGVEVDTAFITALLTVIGFSVQDTIVTFDRIREKLANDPYLKFEQAVDASLTETMARSLTTSATILLTILSLLLIGGATIQTFLVVLLAGVIAGTYSSIGVAAQVLVAWESGDIGRFFRRGKGGGDRSLEERVEAERDETAASELEPVTQN